MDVIAFLALLHYLGYITKAEIVGEYDSLSLITVTHDLVRY